MSGEHAEFLIDTIKDYQRRLTAAEASIELLVEALEGAERALTSAVEAVDAYNSENGTHLCGGALFGMAKALNPARAALSQVRETTPDKRNGE